MARNIKVNQSGAVPFAEDHVDLSLRKAADRLAEWRLHSSEVTLQQLAVDAVDELDDCEPKDEVVKSLLDHKDFRKPDFQQQRAARKAIEALIRWGDFTDTHGKSQDAIDTLEEAVELAKWLTQPQDHGKKTIPEDLSLLARANAGLAKAICNNGGVRGSALARAKQIFDTALRVVVKAQAADVEEGGAAAGDETARLAAEVHLDFAECLYIEADIPSAHTEADAALTAMRTTKPGPTKRRLSQRLVRVRAMVLHDEGAVEAAARLYSEYLEVVGDVRAGALPDPDTTAEYFNMMQNSIIKTEGEGRLGEALERLSDLERLQEAADHEMHVKNDVKFLVPRGTLDRGLWSALARTHQLRGNILLTMSDEDKDHQKSSDLKKLTLQKAQKSAQQAVDMLRQFGHKRDLIDALNTLGNVEMANGRQSKAESALKEALQTSEQEYAANSVYVAASCHNLASVAEARGHKAEALKLYRRALAIETEVLGMANPDTATSLDAVAGILEETDGPTDEVLSISAQAAKSARLAYPENSPWRAVAEARIKRLEKARAARP
eukprot:gnl/TRDRNA2_/TRDRNA2_84204_c0_seq1.p1 gnl/TRDRNA2_/TRDRNA2_84204_c0~~gnl/TRDRNA2_/TRDRNA2_84204_c0_seq1.p1  ORF type:complete len:632 (+),score=159.73 gnl/TRDRNA2_/TRDRNA2_84204_c0_seq1:242-1897(+)